MSNAVGDGDVSGARSGPRRSWRGSVLAVLVAAVVGAVVLTATGTVDTAATGSLETVLPAVVAEPAALGVVGLVALAWFAGGHVGAFAAGQVAVAAVAGTAPIEALLVAEGTLSVLLFAPVVDARHRLRHATVTAAVLAAVGGLGVGVWLAWGSILATAGAIVVLTALLAGLCHRWSLLALGVLADG